MAAYFADTSFWIALFSRRDQYHARAIAWHGVVVKSGSRIVTTEAVLWEWLNALAYTTTRAIAAEGYRRTHADGQVEVVLFEPALNDAAVELYRTCADKDWSLTDCLSFRGHGAAPPGRSTHDRPPLRAGGHEGPDALSAESLS